MQSDYPGYLFHRQYRTDTVTYHSFSGNSGQSGKNAAGSIYLISVDRMYIDHQEQEKRPTRPGKKKRINSGKCPGAANDRAGLAVDNPVWHRKHLYGKET
jgi:hypothetical protein